MNYSKLITSLIIVVSVIFLGGVDFASAGWTTGKYNSAIDFNGTTTFVDGFGAIGNIKSVSFWIKADDITDRKIIDFDGGTSYFEIDASGIIQAQGFTSPTIYIDGKISSTLADTNWHHIAITTDTNVDATTSFKIGKTTITAVDYYFDGKLDDVKIYAYARTADEIRLDYNAGVATHLGPSGKTCSEDPAGCMDYGLVGSWGMDEGTGTTAYDGSDEGNDGLLMGGPKWTTDSSPLAGGGGSLEFDGVDDYVLSGLASSELSGSFSASVWAKADSFNAVHSVGNRLITAWRVAGSSRWAIGATNGYLSSFVNTGSAIITNGTILPLNEWFYTTFVYDGSKHTVYLNGVYDFEVDGAILSAYNDYIRIGIFDEELISGERYWDGSIDSVRIYNRALSAEEVRYHYNKGGPVAEWGFDEGSGTVAYDATPNNNDGTLTNMDDSDWVEGKYGTGLEFDGVDDYVDCGNDSSLAPTCLTVSFMVYIESTLGTTFVLCKAHDTGYSRDYSVVLDSSGIQFWFGNNNPDYVNLIGSVLDTGKWYNIVVTRDGTDAKIYINGVLNVSVGYSFVPIDKSQTLKIGDLNANPARYFNGSIDSVRIYNYARTPSQIQQDYNAGVATHFR